MRSVFNSINLKRWLKNQHKTKHHFYSSRSTTLKQFSLFVRSVTCWFVLTHPAGVSLAHHTLNDATAGLHSPCQGLYSEQQGEYGQRHQPQNTEEKRIWCWRWDCNIGKTDTFVMLVYEQEASSLDFKLVNLSDKLVRFYHKILAWFHSCC